MNKLEKIMNETERYLVVIADPHVKVSSENRVYKEGVL